MDYSRFINDLKNTLEKFFETGSEKLDQVIDLLCESLSSGQKILIFGNGGSASQSQHFAAELINKFLKVRSPLPAISLATDTSALTSIANDFSFDLVFSKQIEALGEKGDVAIGLSTSGNSPNIINAFESARKKGLKTIAITGNGGGKIAAVCDYLLDVPSDATPRIQEVHLLILHIVAEEIEKRCC
ncbi:SIS domain-containing protein [Acidobacteriota bacterium]